MYPRTAPGKLELRRERVELASVVLAAVEASLPPIDQQGHELTVTLPPEPIFLDANLTRRAQVFMNLLTNAVKCTDQGDRIGLTAQRQGRSVAVAVQDSGRSSIMARHALDGRDHFFVGDLLRSAHEGRIPPVHEDGSVRIRVPTKGHEQLGAFRVVQGSEVHRFSPSAAGDLVGESALLGLW
jgi:hypothetical protein